jgi:hypothetical protein
MPESLQGCDLTRQSLRGLANRPEMCLEQGYDVGETACRLLLSIAMGRVYLLDKSFAFLTA